MMNLAVRYDTRSRTTGLERLDLRDGPEDWSQLRDLLHYDLSALDGPVLTRLPHARIRFGSNEGGGAHLFTYRAYEPPTGSRVDAVVVGVTIAPLAGGPADGFRVSGDIAGELRGDVLFECPIRDVVGRTAMTEAARDTADLLARGSGLVLAALEDSSREE